MAGWEVFWLRSVGVFAFFDSIDLAFNFCFFVNNAKPWFLTSCMRQSGFNLATNCFFMFFTYTWTIKSLTLLLGVRANSVMEHGQRPMDSWA